MLPMLQGAAAAWSEDRSQQHQCYPSTAHLLCGRRGQKGEIRFICRTYGRVQQKIRCFGLATYESGQPYACRMCTQQAAKLHLYTLTYKLALALAQSKAPGGPATNLLCSGRGREGAGQVTGFCAPLRPVGHRGRGGAPPPHKWAGPHAPPLQFVCVYAHACVRVCVCVRICVCACVVCVRVYVSLAGGETK